MSADVNQLWRSMSREQRRAAQVLARRQSWQDGELKYKLNPSQQKAYDHYWATSGRFVFEWGRRCGKTFTMCLIAIEVCLRKRGARVVYGALTLTSLDKYVHPAIKKILEDAPPECRPAYSEKHYRYTFPNGSVIDLFGCDDERKADRGRGPEMDLACIDEAGFNKILRYVLREVLKPQALTTGGRLLVGSSPAKEPDHPFTRICELAEATGNYSHATIWDNPLLTPEQIEAYVAEDARDEGYGDDIESYMASPEFEREYLARRVINQLLVVLKEFDKYVDRVVGRVDRPEFYRAFTVVDPGGRHPYAALFGYWHFLEAKLVVEAELNMSGCTTEEFQASLKAIEERLWGVERYDGTLIGLPKTQEGIKKLPDFIQEAVFKQAPQQPWMRWSDTNVGFIRDMYKLHKVVLVPTEKTDLQANVNHLEVHIRSGRILIDPDCRDLIRQGKNTLWKNDQRTEFKETEIQGRVEHGDLVACLNYMVRMMNTGNPYPENWGKTRIQIVEEAKRKQAANDNLRNAWLGRARKRRYS